MELAELTGALASREEAMAENMSLQDRLHAAASELSKDDLKKLMAAVLMVTKEHTKNDPMPDFASVVYSFIIGIEMGRELERRI